MDRSEEAIALARKLYEGVFCHFFHSDIVTEVDYGKHDLVTWWDAIEHFTKEEAEIILDKIVACLSNSDNGRLIGSTPMARETKTNPEHKWEFTDVGELGGFLGKWFDHVDLWTSRWGPRWEPTRVQMYFICRKPRRLQTGHNNVLP